MKRHTIAQRAYIADVVRSVDVLSADVTARRWKEEAERLMEVFDEDNHIEDMISTVMFYGYVRGLEVSLVDHEIFPFDNAETDNRTKGAWVDIMTEYLAEMRKGVGREDVDH